MPILILFPSITFNYETPPLRMSYFITRERPIVPKAARYISRLGYVESKRLSFSFTAD